MKKIVSSMDINFPQYSLKLKSGKPVEVKDEAAKKLLRFSYIKESKSKSSTKEGIKGE